MMFRRQLILSVAVFVLAACNLSVPQVTPTVAPSRTPSRTPNVTATPSITPSRTRTSTPDPTLIAELLASDTPTATQTPTHTTTPSVTATLSVTPSQTPTQTATPSPTSTSTARPTVTPLPTIGPTDTPTPTATATSTLTATNTPRPSATPTRTLSPAEISELLGTPAATSTPVPTATITPGVLPPTIDATPTFITATGPAASVTPVVGTATPFIPPTDTPQPLPSLTPLPVVLPTPLPLLPPINPETRAFVLSPEGVRGGVSLLPDVTLFERNPVNPAQYAVTDSSGLLYFTGLNGENAARVDTSPFSQFIPLSREENNAYVQDIAWSPDGQYLAFLINGDKLAVDGVWYFSPGQFPPLQLLVDCPADGHPGCGIVTSPSGPTHWESLELEWSPAGDALLVRTWLPDQNRAGLTVLPVTRDERARDVRPPAYAYEYGTFSNDGSRILVSGSAPDGNVYIGWINRDGTFDSIVFAGRDNGLWVQNAAQRPDGSIVTLGAPFSEGGPGAAQRIYDAAGRALSDPIGSGPPQRVEWSPDRSAVLMIVNDRAYLARIDGTIADITAEVAGAQAINWISGDVPVVDSPQSTAAPVENSPQSTIGPVGERSENPYPPETRLQVLAPAGLLVRSQPSTDADFIASVLQGGVVVMLPGEPVRDGTLVWYQVRAEAEGVVGWVAGEIDGESMIGP